MQTESNQIADPDGTPPDTGAAWRRAIPFLWLALSAGWAMVIFVTDTLAWPLALWVATTLGPLTALQRSGDRRRSRSPL